MIVRFKDGHLGVEAADGGGRSGGSLQAIAPQLNMYAMEVEDGSTAEQTAKSLQGQPGERRAMQGAWEQVCKLQALHRGACFRLGSGTSKTVYEGVGMGVSVPVCVVGGIKLLDVLPSLQHAA